MRPSAPPSDTGVRGELFRGGLHLASGIWDLRWLLVGRRRRAFTLIELLVVVAVIGILMSLVMPALGYARVTARVTQCTGNLRNIGQGWQMYAEDFRDYAMPQVWFGSPSVYWWGANTNPADYTVGLLAPYLGEEAGLDNVFDCPEQPWGSYIPQGSARGPTTTYGYNGLCFAPPASGWFPGTLPPGCNARWKQMGEVEGASQVFAFADTGLDWTNAGTVSNNCFLDGPMVPWGSRWGQNRYPTLRFRHHGRAVVTFADGHVEAIAKGRARITSTASDIGYVGDSLAPHYVPDWDEWF